MRRALKIDRSSSTGELEQRSLTSLRTPSAVKDALSRALLPVAANNAVIAKVQTVRSQVCGSDGRWKQRSDSLRSDACAADRDPTPVTVA